MPGFPFSRRAPKFLLKEALHLPIGRERNVVRARWPPIRRNCRLESIDQAFGEGVKGARGEAVCELRRATLSHASGEIVGCVALKRDRQNAKWRGTKACFEKIGSALREKFGLAGARPRNDAGRARLAQSAPSVRFEILDAPRSPIFRSEQPHGHPASGGCEFVAEGAAAARGEGRSLLRVRAVLQVHLPPALVGLGCSERVHAY